MKEVPLQQASSPAFSGITSRRNARLRPVARTALRWAWVNLLYLSGMLRWARWRLGKRGSVLVLTFHRVLPDDEREKTKSPAGMVIRQNTFDELARCVAKYYQPIRLEDAAPGRGNGSKLPIAFSFDDGWEDNARVAAPIARKYDIPLTVFICPGRMGISLPYWPERVAALCEAAAESGGLEQFVALLGGATEKPVEWQKRDQKAFTEDVIAWLKTLPAHQRDAVLEEVAKRFGAHPRAAESGATDSTMPWADARALANDGVTFGSHTQSHQILPRISPPEAARELDESKLAIQRQLGTECQLFSYPNGDWTHEVRAQVAQAGYRLAFLNQPGAWTRESDSLLIPRVNLWEGSVIGPAGRFSRIAFEYATIWKAYRAPQPR
jgi:peptidoglycan/xylan/chitin deacetylase (PgdA/CDA1 family)